MEVRKNGKTFEWNSSLEEFIRRLQQPARGQVKPLEQATPLARHRNDLVGRFYALHSSEWLSESTSELSASSAFTAEHGDKRIEGLSRTTSKPHCCESKNTPSAANNFRNRLAQGSD